MFTRSHRSVSCRPFFSSISSQTVTFHWRTLLCTCCLLFLLLFTNFVAPWSALQPAVASAASQHNPNPKLSPPAWLKPLPPKKQPKQGDYRTMQPDNRKPVAQQWRVSMTPATLHLTDQAQQFVSNDGQLEVDIAAGTISAAQVKQAGGSLLLTITQVIPASGGLRSTHIFFGTYQFQLHTAAGQPVSGVVLTHPLVIQYHLQKVQATLLIKGQEVYALWHTGDVSTLLTGLTPPKVKPALSLTKKSAPSSPPASKVLPATGDPTGLIWSISSNLSSDIHVHTALSSSTITFGTQAPQANWGSPQDFQVDLNAGGLSYTYPLVIPPGPGGFAPPLTLTYSSGSVNESHNLQAAAPWVGEGWNLSLGSVSWSEENVTPGGTNKIESIWSISDPTGISGQLIPPDVNASTVPPYVPSPLPAQYIWHTAPESHAKVQELMFNGQPCWRAWLPTGIIEDFGCTNDSRQSYIDSNSVDVQWRWDLDLMIDRYGNQIHVHYQQNYPSSGYVRDSVLSSIEYDDPTCHNTTTACSTWNPLIKIVFDASDAVPNANLTNSGCQNWSSSSHYRCDDPLDLSGSGGLPVPKIVSTFVLNDLKVEVSGNVLHEYVFSYEQTKPTTFEDPSTGQQESYSGYLDLTAIQSLGTSGTVSNDPTVTIQYMSRTQHYEDTYQYAQPEGFTNCGASWIPRDGNGCFLWAADFSSRYIINLDNGRGWNETIGWTEARNNTHGVNSGSAVDDAFACANNTSGVCNEADDHNWSRIVVSQRTAVSNGVTSTWTYQYYMLDNLATNSPGTGCPNCNQGYTWGNQNDDDFLDYYNGQFRSFHKVIVTLPDNSYQYHYFGSTNGWGLAESSLTCYLPSGYSCSVAPYWGSETGTSGKELQEQVHDSQNNYLSLTLWTVDPTCPATVGMHSSPPGLVGPPNNPGDTQLISELDQNNPVLVCDPRMTQEDQYQIDGVTSNYQDPRVVHTTTTTAYVSGPDYGNISNVGTSGNDSSDTITSHQGFYPNDNIGGNIYLTDLPAITQTWDGSGTPYSCSQAIYGSNNNVSTPPTVPGITQAQSYTVGGANGCSDNSNLITVQHGYDASGNPITGIDGDGHLGCSNGSSTYSACAIYDSFATHIASAKNALNQTTTYGYDSSAAGGFGQWLTATTDANNQTTAYQYDVLGRLIGVVRPGDNPSTPTVTYTYINTCTPGSTTPCLEMDTATTFTSGGTPTTMKQWYDGWGHLVETQTPSPNGKTIVTYTIYDALGRPTTKSLSYAITNPTGYVSPDLTQARSVTAYDGLGRSLGGVTYSDAHTIVLSTTLTYIVALGVPTLSGESNNPYEQTASFDAYNHQQITYTDALGRTRYTQYFSGTASPYSVIRTVGNTYDILGDTTQVQTYDHTGVPQATYTATFDALKRLTGFNDSDLGSCSNTPLPPGCSNSSDTAWKLTYDADGNQLSQSDPRNQSVYTSYDLLDRPLCNGTSLSSVNPCQSSSYAQYFYDSYNNGSNPTLPFPSGCTAPSGSYASDPIGRPTAEAFNGNGANGWRCYGYDQRGQQDQSSLSITAADGQSLTQTMNMAYNDGGELTALVYPDGETLTSKYDVNGRFQSAYFGTGSTPNPVPFLASGLSYTDVGQLSSMAMGGTGPKNGGATTTPSIFTTSFGYDAIQRPLSVSAVLTSTSQTVWSQARTYDNVGNVLGLTTTVPSISGGTKTDVESFCYDALDRLAWAGDTGNPTGGDHCGSAPSGTNINTYQQSYSYDDLDRMTSGPSGTMTYGAPNHPHAVTGLSTVANQYATYNADGEMVCRNIATGTGHTCGGGSPNGAAMTYDAAGRLTNWTAPSGTTASDSFLYDNAGNRVLQTTSNTSNGTTTTTDTITFDGYTETSITSGATTTIKYYSLNGQKVAMHWNGVLYYLLSDSLGSSTVALKDDGTTQAAQLFAPYGAVRHSSGTMPTTYNFTGQRLDSETGLLYYNFRYYDPVSGRFVRADTVDTNAKGKDSYAYVGDSPEDKADSTGHDGGNLGDPVAQAYVEAWYAEIETDSAVVVDQPADMHNPDVAIKNAAMPEWDGSIAGLNKLIQNLGSMADNGTRGNGYPDIMNLSNHLIYEVKGGTPQPDGSTGFPSDYTVAYGWAQARWYAARANRDSDWGALGIWSPGSLTQDPRLAETIAECGGVSCEERMPDGRLITITYAGRGVLTYEVTTNEPPKPISSLYYPSIYARYLLALGGIALVAAVVTGVVTGGGGYPGGSGGYEGGYGNGYGRVCSFTATTFVETPQGEKPIGQLVVGDQVMAYNVGTGMMEMQTVEQVWIHNDSDLMDVTITFMVGHQSRQELLHTTNLHPFLTQERGFVPVAQLQVGMHVLRADGSVGTITRIQAVSATMVMYNLEITNDHTFVVGTGQWIVHNTCIF